MQDNDFTCLRFILHFSEVWNNRLNIINNCSHNLDLSVDYFVIEFEKRYHLDILFFGRYKNFGICKIDPKFPIIEDLSQNSEPLKNLHFEKPEISNI